MKIIYVLAFTLFTLPLYSQAEVKVGPTFISYNGNSGFGLNIQDQSWFARVAVSGLFGTTGYTRSESQPFLHVGYKLGKSETTKFGIGVNYFQQFITGESTAGESKRYLLGPALSIEHNMTPEVLLFGWANPIAYVHDDSLLTTAGNSKYVYGSGGLGLAYLF